jgi:hypothetical protein
VSYFAVFLCGFAPLREEGAQGKGYFTQSRKDAKMRKAKLRHYCRSLPNDIPAS